MFVGELQKKPQNIAYLSHLVSSHLICVKVAIIGSMFGWFMDLWLLLILWLARRLRIWDSCLIQKRLRMLIFMVAKLFRVRERCLKNPNGIRTTNELKRCFAFIGRKEVWRPFYVKRWVIEEIFQEESQKRSNSCHKSKLSIRAWKWLFYFFKSRILKQFKMC